MYSLHWNREMKIASRCSIISGGWEERSEMNFSRSGVFHLCISDRDCNSVSSELQVWRVPAW